MVCLMETASSNSQGRPKGCRYSWAWPVIMQFDFNWCPEAIQGLGVGATATFPSSASSGCITGDIASSTMFHDVLQLPGSCCSKPRLLSERAVEQLLRVCMCERSPVIKPEHDDRKAPYWQSPDASFTPQPFLGDSVLWNVMRHPG